MQYALDLDDGWSPRSPGLERLFICLMPDPETGVRVAGFCDWFLSTHRLRGARLRTDRFHLSLHHIGDFPRLPTRKIYGVRLAAKTVSMRPFDVEFRFMKSFEPAPHKKDRRPLVLLGEGGEALTTLFRTLGFALVKNGLKAAAGFTPHMTLAYGPDAVPVQEIEPIRFVAKDFVLIHSRLGLTQYEEIGRWPLA